MEWRLHRDHRGEEVRTIPMVAEIISRGLAEGYMVNRKTVTDRPSFPHHQGSRDRLLAVDTKQDGLVNDPSAELLEALKGRMPEAFGMLIQLHERRLLGTAMKITRNREDAEDAVQNTFLQVYRYIEGFRGECQFTSWLTRILINQSFMLLRRRKNSTVSIDDCAADRIGAVPREIEDPCHTPEESLLKKELSERLMCALRNLRVRNRAVAELHYLEQLSTDEIANAMGISIPAAKSRLNRARQQLRRDGPRQLQPPDRPSSTLYRRTPGHAAYSSFQG